MPGQRGERRSGRQETIEQLATGCRFGQRELVGIEAGEFARAGKQTDGDQERCSVSP